MRIAIFSALIAINLFTRTSSVSAFGNFGVYGGDTAAAWNMVDSTWYPKDLGGDIGKIAGSGVNIAIAGAGATLKASAWNKTTSQWKDVDLVATA